MEVNNRTRPDWIDDTLYPFKDNWMIIDGHLIHYVDEGPRNATVLLFVHPGAGWSLTYRYHIQQLKKDFRCVAPDLPGYGLSEAADDYGYTLLDQASVLERFVEALDLRGILAGQTTEADRRWCSPYQTILIGFSDSSLAVHSAGRSNPIEWLSGPSASSQIDSRVL